MILGEIGAGLLKAEVATLQAGSWPGQARQFLTVLSDLVNLGECGLTALQVFLARVDWATPGILEALIPGRMQGHGGTEEVPG